MLTSEKDYSIFLFCNLNQCYYYEPYTQLYIISVHCLLFLYFSLLTNIENRDKSVELAIIDFEQES